MGTCGLGWLTPTAVQELAGPRSFARGAAYRRDGRVELRTAAAGLVRARVRGSMPYEVELGVQDGMPAWSCSCPVGEDGSFCKHCVAVALVAGADVDVGGDGANGPAHGHDDARGGGALSGGLRGPIGGDVDIRAYLDALPAERLVDLLAEQVAQDWRLRERLVAEASAATGRGVDVATWRRRIEVAFDGGDFVPYAEAAGWAAGVDEVLDGLDDLLAAGHADPVVELAEHAHRLADEAMQHVDDSDGWLRGISERIGDLHRKACEVSRPDPVELAGRLVDLELTSELDAFHRAAARYAHVLGPAGVTEYLRLVEPRWRALGPTDDPRDENWTEQFRAREAMMGVALATGDPEQVIEVKRRDLRVPGDYLEIAVSLHGAGRVDDAVEWARRGLAAFPDRPWQTPPLRESLAGWLRGQGDVALSVELFWEAFDTHPSLDAYRRLLQEAEVAAEPERWRQQAIGALRARVAQRRPGDQTARSLVVSTPVAALVEILLYEGAADDAWDVASKHGCDHRLWLVLARACETTRPLDAVEVYEREVATQIDNKNNNGYRRAVDVLARIRMLAIEAGEPRRFEQLVTTVRDEHGRKRNLMGLLDANGW